MTSIKKHVSERDSQLYNVFCNLAKNFASLSHAKRSKVGAVLVDKCGRIISTGYNGTPSGFNEGNTCEDENDVTKPTVIHAELNAILNATVHDISGSTLYLTLSPCAHCAALIIHKHIKKVVYVDTYRNTEGLDILINNNIEVIHFQLD